MIKTLYGKIVVILLSLFFVTGLLFVLVTLFTTRLYVQEGAQRLNSNLADYLVSQRFFLQEGKVNKVALKESFAMLMDINPSIELYLLDPKGAIMAYSAPDEKVKRKRVDLAPIHLFLSKGGSLPILGDDPRGLNRQKVFSVSPIPQEGPLEGYLYIILGGEEYDSVASMLQKNYIFRLSIWITIAGLLCVVIIGLYLFKVLTKRLRKLASAMETFEKGDFLEPVTFITSDRDSDDEIDRLGSIFSKMSDRIFHQITTIKETDKLRRELVSNVSHDLRTPLTSLQGYLETLLLKGDELDREEQKQYLETAINHSKRLGKLITELFELSKLESRETEVKAEPFHIGELVQDMVQKNELLAQKKNITLKTAFPEKLPFVLADIALIERAIQNLIDNALRYTKRGSTITIALKPEKSMIAVKVTDEGTGIKEQDIPYIFDRFYRAQKEQGKDSDSTGLGLAITKRIVELHGSSIDVLSELNMGTTFSFRLPVYRTNP
jgi:two-component system OmpR family sensor kinase